MEITSRQAAEQLGVTQQRIQTLFSAGDLRGRKVAGRLVIDTADVQARLLRRSGNCPANEPTGFPPANAHGFARTSGDSTPKTSPYGCAAAPP
jgi:hypothetical protein